MTKVYIKKNPNGDTRTAKKDVSFDEFHEANMSHKRDVMKVMLTLCCELWHMGAIHDYTKIEYEKEFYDNFIDSINNGTDFVSNTWYQKHIHEERHHPFSYCHEDITLLDIIETIVDCVCAGKTRSGEIRSLEFDEEILKKAVDNTVKLIDNIVEVED